MVLALLPGSWILDRSAIGPFGEWVLDLETQAVDLMVWGSMIAVGLGIVFATLADARPLHSLLREAGRRLSAIPAWPFALACGLASALLAGFAFHFLFHGLPTNVDSIASLLQGRFMARGVLSGPNPESPSARLILNTLVTDEGWISFYPPLHPALLAAGLRLGNASLVGPLLTGITVTLASRLAIDILPEGPGTARLAGILMVASPFIVFVGGSYLSHTSAAAGIALTAWTAHRARDDGWLWSVAAGMATGFAVSARPWPGLLVCGGILVTLWLPALRTGQRGLTGLARRAAGATAGGLPFAISLLAYNAHFFGHPLRLGYEVAYGPAHGLGFHPDPWGYPYGPFEALGYTAADLTSMSLHLLEIPLPVVAIIGLYLLVARRMPGGAGLFLLWALLPVVGNMFYWHHGFHLGPRMLFEAAPAWCALLALATTHLAADPEKRNGHGAGSPADYLSRVALGALLVASLGPLFLVPARLSAHAWDHSTLSRMMAPSPPTERALVFVHGSWSERISARLQASGMRLDSLELALRRNDLCRVDQYARARESGDPLPRLDFQAEPGMPRHLQAVEVPGGLRIRRDPNTPLRPECQRQIRADRLGTVPLAPLLWQGDLPGIEERAPLFVRDLGPEENRQVLERYPKRKAFLYYPSRTEEAPVLAPYTEGMRKLWNDAGDG